MLQSCFLERFTLDAYFDLFRIQSDTVVFSI